MLTSIPRYHQTLPTLNTLLKSFASTTTVKKPVNNLKSKAAHTKKPKDPVAEVPSLLITGPLAVSGTIAGNLAAYLGGVEARASNLSPIGAFVLATLGGAGGGTLRACLCGQPASWISAPGYMYTCLAAGGAGYFGLLEKVRKSRAGKLFMQAIFKLSIPGCAIVGGEIGKDTNAFTGMLFGLITSTGGGFIRDVVLSRRPGALTYGNTFVEAAPVMVGSLLHSITYEPLKSRPNVRYLTTIGATLWLNRYLSKRYLGGAAAAAVASKKTKPLPPPLKKK